MFTTIIVGYDGTPRGAAALDLARSICDASGTVHLVCVFPHTGEAGRGGQYEQVLEQEAEATLADGRARVTGVRVTTRALSDASPARALTEYAETIGADLVVLGPTHRGTVGRIVLGTTAQRLLHGAPCAVAIAPPDHAADRVRHVGVAYDGSPEARAALDRGYAVAAEAGAAVTIYTVAEAPSLQTGMAAATTGYADEVERYADDQARALLADAAARAPEGVSAETTLLHGRPSTAITDRANGVVDLLLVGSRGYGPLRRALLGSVSAALVAHAAMPVLVLPRTAPAAQAAPAEPAAAAAG